MTYETSKDILEETPANSLILVQTSTLGYATSGVMQRIARSYPTMFKEFKEFCSWFKDFRHQDEVIGTTMALKFPPKDPNFGKIIACCFTLKWLTSSRAELELDAWEKVARKVASQTLANYKTSGTMYEIHIPAKIGSNLKDVEQEQVKEILNKTFTKDYPEVNLWYHT